MQDESHRYRPCFFCAIASSAFAQTATTEVKPTCKAQATDKKLAGAALTSFMKKCETDAAAVCDTAAVDKKLAGAAKTSFAKKCVADAVGG
jgi:psiF repeat